MTWQTTNGGRPITLGDLMKTGWFSVHQLVGRTTITMEHFTDPEQRNFGAPRRIITGRVIAVSQAPDGDVAIRFDGLPVYVLAPSDVIRFGFEEEAATLRVGLGRSW